MGGTSRRAMLGCVTLLILSVSEATALTGNEYRILQPSQRVTFVLGVFDGWGVMGTISKAVRESEGSMTRLFSDIFDCAVTKGMTQGQIQAIVDKYITDHPASWHLGAGQLVFLAMTEACTR